MSNSGINEQDFFNIFERFIDCMTNPGEFKREIFIQILTDFCRLFDLCRGVTEFYTGPCEEKAGKGEILEDYNDGREGEVVLSKRIVTSQMTVIKSTLYRPKGAVPLSELDMKRLDLVDRALLTFVSRNRLQTEIDRLAFYDLAGYPNMNSFNRQLVQLSSQNALRGKAAVMYNLRNFSLVNSDLGKENGDKIMKIFYDAVKEACGKGCVTARVGGDNFAAVFDADNLGEVIQILNGHC